MAIKLPKDFIESDYRFTACVPKPKIETEKKPDGSFSMYASYDASEVRDFAQRIARDMNEKLGVELIDELLRLNGYVPERTCHVVSTIQRESYIEGQTVFEYEHELSCGHIATSGYKAPPNYCFECGARVIGG